MYVPFCKSVDDVTIRLSLRHDFWPPLKKTMEHNLNSAMASLKPGWERRRPRRVFWDGNQLILASSKHDSSLGLWRQQLSSFMHQQSRLRRRIKIFSMRHFFIYEVLQEQIDKTPHHDILILMGNFNAKVESDNAGYESCMGKEGVGDRNNNGQHFADMCLENGLIIGGTIFQHKNIHKLTWNSPDGRTCSQIDHICINQKWRGSMRDVKAIRGADVSSDHHLMLCKLKLKLKKARKEQREPLYDSGKLKDPTVKN